MKAIVNPEDELYNLIEGGAVTAYDHWSKTILLQKPWALRPCRWLEIPWGYEGL